MSPFRNILRFFIGDFSAKAIHCLVFVYLARVLGVNVFGTLEFAAAILTYLLLLADGGLELWAIREAAWGRDPRGLASRVLPLRCVLAGATFGALLMLLPIFPNYPGLQTLLVLFGLTLFAQAVSLKWAFMGRERMTSVGGGLLLSQVVFAAAVISTVRSPERVLWVPLFRLLAEMVVSSYFWVLFRKEFGGGPILLSPRTSLKIFAQALPLGAAHGLAMMSFNFDAVLLGMLLDPSAVGLYSAAYKPVTLILAVHVTYFVGLFPLLCRTHAEDQQTFQLIVRRLLNLSAMAAIPVGVALTFLAHPVIRFLYGAGYEASGAATQVLGWSAVLVILRGTFRQSLNASGYQQLDLLCAASATVLNVVLNFVFIPRFGILGSAAATVASEVVWLTLASISFCRVVARVHWVALLWRPVLAGTAMAGVFLLTESCAWPLQSVLALAVYVSTSWLFGNHETWKSNWRSVTAHRLGRTRA